MVKPTLRPQADVSGDRICRQIVGLLRELVNIAAVQRGNVHPIGAVLTVTDVV